MAPKWLPINGKKKKKKKTNNLNTNISNASINTDYTNFR